MKRVLFGLVSALICSIGIAQALSTSINLGWTAPTTNTDGSVLSSSIAYNVYQGTSATGPWTKVATNVSGTSTTITSTGGNCFAVSTVETIGASATESALSTSVCSRIPLPPTGLAITLNLVISATASSSAATAATQAPAKAVSK